MYLDQALSDMCGYILINMFVCLCVCQIYLYFCIKLYIPVFVQQNGKNAHIFCFTFVWRTLFLCRTHFCGAPCRHAPQNYSAWGPAELFLWRTRLGARTPCVTEKKMWRQLCGAPANPPGAPQNVKMVRHR